MHESSRRKFLFQVAAGASALTLARLVSAEEPKGELPADDAYAKANEKARFRPLLKHPPTDFTEA